MDLTRIRGIGDRLAQRIVENFGSEEELNKAINNLEVNKIAMIDGVSQKMAIDIINYVLGNPTQDFLKTERAFKLYEDIIARILEFSHTEYGKNKILLLAPVKDENRIYENLDFVMKAKRTVEKLPIEDISRLLQKIDSPSKDRPKYDSGKVIVVESREDYHTLTDMKLNRYCSIITPDELQSLEDFEFIIYVYSDGMIDFGDAKNVFMIKNDSKEFEIVPEIVLSYFFVNYELIRNIYRIKGILKRESILGEVIQTLNSLQSWSVHENEFDEAVNIAKTKVDKKLRENIKKIDLRGDEVLKILNDAMPDKIQRVFDETLKEAKKEIEEKTGYNFDPFIQKYPIEIDEKELERVKKQAMAEKHMNAFEKKVNAASKLLELKDAVENEIREILEFDYEFALGCFAHYYQLNPAEISDGFYFKNALHLDIALEPENKVQKIEYLLRKPENVVLLTGANSGGKTTLLETLAQISIMAQMGLPVCAEQAQVKIVDELYLFSQKRAMDAGAFESFLTTFIPIVTKDADKLILLDELEAITELEAALKIISSFIDFIKDSNSHAVIVTHMAREIMEHTKLRVDGIEATGLDENYNLIVDRTPKMNYFAKSTPELILRMIYEKSEGKLREIYGRILEKF